MTKTEEILELLRSKNRCLERLSEETRKFLSAPLESLILHDDQAISPLSKYDEVRASLIKTLQLHDRQIDTINDQTPVGEKTAEFLEQAKFEVLRNQKLIASVFNADEIVFERIREAQNQIGKLIQENRKSRDILAKFKSGISANTGDGVDRTL